MARRLAGSATILASSSLSAAIQPGFRRTPLVILGVILQFLGFVCGVVILEHAFRKSLGQGLLSLLVPLYLLYFMFAKLESPRRRWLISGFSGLFLGPILIIVTTP